MPDSARAWTELRLLLRHGAAILLTPEQAAAARFRVPGAAPRWDGPAGKAHGGPAQGRREPGDELPPTGELRRAWACGARARARSPHAPRFSIYADWAYLAAVAERAGRRNRAEAVAAWREMAGERRA